VNSTFLLLTVHNPGAAPTGIYDQQVVLDSAAYAGLINSNFTNVEVSYFTNSAPIYTWIESNASNSSTSTTLWMRLDSIPGDTSVQIALTFGPKYAFDLSESGYVGESPRLSPVYAEFDNGWRVFNFYDNFSGSALSSHLWDVAGGWSVTVGQGVQIKSVPGSGENISSRTSFNYPSIVDFYGNLYQTSAASAYLTEGIGLDACTGCGTAQGLGWDGSYTGNGPSPYASYGFSGDYGSSVFPTSQQYGVFTTLAYTQYEADFELNYTPVASLYADIPPSPEPVGLAMSGFPAGSLTDTSTTVWIRERAYVPVPPELSLQLVGTPTGALVAYPGTLATGDSLTLATTIGGGIAPYSFNYTGLPPGCRTANASTLSCVVTAAGQFTPNVEVSDAGGTTTNFTTNVTVTSNATTPPTPTPLTATLAEYPSSVVVGQSVTFLTFASGGTPPYEYAYSGLPSGCASANSPAIACAPSTAGRASVTVRVTDSATGEANASVLVDVENPAAVPLNLTFAAYPGDAFVNQTVTLIATASGGHPAYIYSYTGLPYGCTSQDTAALSCTPSVPGHYLVTVTVRDSVGATAASEANVTVRSLPTTGVAPVSTTSSIPASTLYGIAAGIGVAVALGAAALAVSLARRRSAPPSAPEG
jgi:hypothetical protein